MSTRTFVDKNGNSWEWEETPETVKAVEELARFAGNYDGMKSCQSAHTLKSRCLVLNF